MPLWLQGMLESAQAAIISAVLVLVPLSVVGATGGFRDGAVDQLARMAGDAWMVIHGVPLQLTFSDGQSSASVAHGTLWLVPLALTFIPFLLSWRAGRRLARASYTNQLWQALLGFGIVYAGMGLATAFICSTPDVNAPLLLGTLVPLIPVGIGLLVGARREAGGWGRLIGVNVADWIARTSQHSRWAGSYLYSAIRAGFVALMTALAMAAALLVVNILWHWADIVAVYEGLKPGAAGGSVLTLAQLGYLPNLAVWALAWASGAGFSLGTGTSVSPLGTVVTPVPAIPLMGALPVGQLTWGVVAMVIPVLAGALAGWWFVREGENHFDEWLAIRFRARWLTATASTVVLGALIGAVAGLLAGVLALLSHGSAGIGRLTDLGPNFLTTAGWIAVEVALGAIIGSAVGPWLERSKDADYQHDDDSLAETL